MKKVMLLICLFVLVCAFHLSAQMGPSCYEGSLSDSSNGKYLQQLLSPSFDSNNLRTYLFDCTEGDFYIDCGNQYKEKFSSNAIVKRGEYGLAIATNADNTPLTVTLDKPIKEPTIWLDAYMPNSSNRDFIFTYANDSKDTLSWKLTDFASDLEVSNGVDAPKSFNGLLDNEDINTIRFTLDNKNNLKIYINYDPSPIYSFKSQTNGSPLKKFEISPLYSNELVYNLEILSSPQEISNCTATDFDNIESILNQASPGDYLDDYKIKYGPKGRLVINKGPANKNGITPSGDYIYSYKFDLNGGNNFTIILDIYMPNSSDRDFVFRYGNGVEDRLKWILTDFASDLEVSNGVDAPKSFNGLLDNEDIDTIRFEKNANQMNIFVNKNVNPIYSFKTEGKCLQELEFRLYKGEWIYGFSLKNN